MRLSEHLAARRRDKKLLVMTHVVCGYPSFEDNWRELEIRDQQRNSDSRAIAVVAASRMVVNGLRFISNVGES